MNHSERAQWGNTVDKPIRITILGRMFAVWPIYFTKWKELIFENTLECG